MMHDSVNAVFLVSLSQLRYPIVQTSPTIAIASRTLLNDPSSH